MSHLVAPPSIHRLSMKGKFNVYLLLPFGEKLIFSIEARSTIRDSTKTVLNNCQNGTKAAKQSL